MLGDFMTKWKIHIRCSRFFFSIWLKKPFLHSRARAIFRGNLSHQFFLGCTSILKVKKPINPVIVVVFWGCIIVLQPFQLLVVENWNSRFRALWSIFAIRFTNQKGVEQFKSATTPLVQSFENLVYMISSRRGVTQFKMLPWPFFWNCWLKKDEVQQ